MHRFGRRKKNKVAGYKPAVSALCGKYMFSGFRGHIMDSEQL